MKYLILAQAAPLIQIFLLHVLSMLHNCTIHIRTKVIFYDVRLYGMVYMVTAFIFYFYVLKVDFN